MIGKFFHIPKPKQFYIPYRYYNPEEEEREERKKRIKSELGIKEERDPDKPYRPNIKGSFRRAAGNSKTSAEERSKSNTRLLVLVLVLVLIAYLFFYSNLFS